MNTNGLQIRNEHREVRDNCRAIKEALAYNKIEIDSKRKRVGTLRSQAHWLGGLPTRWHG